MEPIGLALKRDGELMIVHKCLGCGKISCNRIAGDDNTYTITSLLETSTAKSSNDLKLLTKEDSDQVLTVLYGYNYHDKI